MLKVSELDAKHPNFQDKGMSTRQNQMKDDPSTTEAVTNYGITCLIILLIKGSDVERNNQEIDQQSALYYFYDSYVDN